MSSKSSQRLEPALQAHRDDVIAAHNQLKKARIQRTFDFFSQCLVLLFIVMLVYYNGLMLLPHLTPILWALLWSVFLHKPLKTITRMLQRIDSVIAPYRVPVYLGSLVLYLLTLFAGADSLLGVIFATAVFSLWSFLIWANRSTVAATLCLAVASFLVCFPLFFFIKSCIAESQALVIKIQAFVDENPQFQTLLDDFGSSPYYKWFASYAQTYGWEVPAWDAAVVKAKIVDTAMQFSHHFTNALGGVLGVLADSVNVLVAFVTFSSCLFYFLQTQLHWGDMMADLSPFSHDDSSKLLKSLNKSVVSVFVSTIAVGASHMLGTYLVFYFVGIDIALILSFIAGFTAVLPVLSSWVVWVPVAAGLGLTGSPMKALLVVTVQLLLMAGDSLIFSIIPGNSFLVGMSLAMGLYVFGTLGIILGPLLSGFMVTVLEVYISYQRPESVIAAAVRAASPPSFAAGAGSDSGNGSSKAVARKGAARSGRRGGLGVFASGSASASGSGGSSAPSSARASRDADADHRAGSGDATDDEDSAGSADEVSKTDVRKRTALVVSPPPGGRRIAPATTVGALGASLAGGHGRRGGRGARGGSADRSSGDESSIGSWGSGGNGRGSRTSGGDGLAAAYAVLVSAATTTGVVLSAGLSALTFLARKALVLGRYAAAFVAGKRQKAA